MIHNGGSRAVGCMQKAFFCFFPFERTGQFVRRALDVRGFVVWVVVCVLSLYTVFILYLPL
jgi:hypothetical protein